ncbi:MAG: Apolipoprotein N-acyltransferase / Copper homeostasis protein CutE, partial [uncultured Cytophagales bacterium]
ADRAGRQGAQPVPEEHPGARGGTGRTRRRHHSGHTHAVRHPFAGHLLRRRLPGPAPPDRPAGHRHPAAAFRRLESHCPVPFVHGRVPGGGKRLFGGAAGEPRRVAGGRRVRQRAGFGQFLRRRRQNAGGVRPDPPRAHGVQRDRRCLCLRLHPGAYGLYHVRAAVPGEVGREGSEGVRNLGSL